MTTIAGSARSQDLTSFSLEELMNVKVTSVSRKAQMLSKVGAAVYVITQEDIRRSGMTSVPELLRMVPGVNVARITASAWAISIRGFNDRYSTRVLVLIDGRTVYTQEFGGVFWDQQTVPVEEIERIEVIRGPGGTVWGANAANGVINVITKKSEDTPGGLMSAATGSQDSAQGYARYGGKLGSASYRVYGRYFNVENSRLGNSAAAGDGWSGAQAGFRADWTVSENDALTIQGDTFTSNQGERLTTILSNDGFKPATFEDRVEAKTKNILGRWKHTFANGSQTALQVFYSDASRIDQGDDDQDTTDVDFQYQFRAGDRHEFVSGVGYRRATLAYEGFYNFRYNAPEFGSNLFSAFLQDEITLSKSWAFTVGSKLEHNSFTQFEFEPSAQLVWSPNDQEAAWFSASRAIRQPSWLYANSIVDIASFPTEEGGTSVFRLFGNPNSQAERIVNLEAGYRKQLSSRFSFDVTAFRTYYRSLATVERGQPYFQSAPIPHLVLPAMWQNLASARNYGVEAFATWQVTDRWRLSPGFSFLHMNVIRDRTSNDLQVETVTGNTPKHQLQLRSTVNLTRSVEWDTSAYYVGGLRPNLDGVAVDPIGRYTRLDTRLAWRVGEFTELSVTGQNLLGPRRMEFPNTHQLNATPVQRAVVGKVTWRF